MAQLPPIDHLTPSMNCSPAGAQLGERTLIVGTGLDPDPPVVMVKVDEFELPPPGAGLNTVTVAAPALATSAAVIWAVS